jgi:hypothetical protein
MRSNKSSHEKAVESTALFGICHLLSAFPPFFIIQN